jgi:hypothetical protein
MRQRLTDAQLSELSEEAKSKLVAWCYTRPFHNDFGFIYLTIGQLIWFLHEHDDDELAFGLYCLIHEGTRASGNKWTFNAEELLPALWESVKRVLSRGGQ